MSVSSLSAVDQGVCEFLSAREGRMCEELGSHVAIPTGHNHAPGLDEYRGILRERLEALGAEIELIPGDPKPRWLLGADHGAPPPTLIARRLREGRPRILIAGHIDTVFAPDGPFRSMAISSDGATAVGPGVVDMKGGVLILIHALEALEEAGVDVGWTVLLNSDEETGSYHSDAALISEAKKHDFGIATEPALPGGELAIERMGSGQFRIEALGRSAHVGRDFTAGVSAVTALSQAVCALSEMVDPSRGLIMSVGPLSGGSATNAVPDRALAWGNVRFPDAETADEIRRMLESVQVNRDADGALPKVIVEHNFNRPAKNRIEATDQLAGVASRCAEALGQSLPLASTGGVCDGNILQAAGLPTIDTMGVRGGGLHTHGEWIELASLVERSQLMALTLRTLTEEG